MANPLAILLPPVIGVGTAVTVPVSIPFLAAGVIVGAGFLWFRSTKAPPPPGKNDSTDFSVEVPLVGKIQTSVSRTGEMITLRASERELHVPLSYFGNNPKPEWLEALLDKFYNLKADEPDIPLNGQDKIAEDWIRALGASAIRLRRMEITTQIADAMKACIPFGHKRLPPEEGHGDCFSPAF